MTYTVLLMQDAVPALVPCQLTLNRRGLRLEAVGQGGAPAGTPPAAPTGASAGTPLSVPTGTGVGVPWSAVTGFDADASGVAPDGSRRQVLVVRTEAGTLRLFVPATTASAILAAVAGWSATWRRCRTVRNPVGRAVRHPLGTAGDRLGRLDPGAMVRGWAAATLAAVSMVAASVTLAVRTAGSRLRPWAAPTAARVQGLVASRVRAPWRPGSTRWLGPAVPLAATLAVVTSALGVLVLVGPTASGAPQAGPPAALAPAPDSSSLGRLARAVRGIAGRPLNLPAATAPPAPAPPSLANAAPLSSHEVFGFAPYWTLGSSGGFSLAGLTTLAYFSIGVNADGSLSQSGDGWTGYQSQALADLVTRAHAAGDRVVLTVSAFDQAALDQLTSSPTAPATLSAALIPAIEAKNLDGVNIDFEGNGPADQAGLTNLVTRVSTALHQVDPHWQVTVDTYASSAGDPTGFYDVPALAPSVDAFFVMAYQLNLAATAQARSPLTSGMFSDLSTAQEYAAVVAPGKVILGLPYFGYDWPTTDGTLAAQATGDPVATTYGAVMASGHPLYWDDVTNTAWTSYEVGGQWHEAYVENPSSLYMAAQLAQRFHFAGVGIWALGMDGNDITMLAALDGFVPARKTLGTGPRFTTFSTTTTSAPVPGQPSVPVTTAPAPGGPAGAPQGPPPTVAPAPGGTAVNSYRYSGVFGGQTVTLALAGAQAVPAGPQIASLLTGFVTTDPGFACLAAEPGLRVWPLPGSTTQDLVVADPAAGDCTKATFVFTVPAVPAGSPPSGGSGSTTTTTSTTSVSTTTTTAHP